jgi:hypothetical protein
MGRSRPGGKRQDDAGYLSVEVVRPRARLYIFHGRGQAPAALRAVDDEGHTVLVDHAFPDENSVMLTARRPFTGQVVLRW